MTQAITLFADFNNADSKGRLRLNTNGALADLNSLSIKLISGMPLILDDKCELRVVGIAEFSEEEKIWVARINWDDIISY